MRHPLDVRAWVDADVGKDARDLDVVWGARPGNGDAHAAEVADRLEALVADDLLAADVAPGDEDEGVTPIDPGDEGGGEAEAEVCGARRQRLIIVDGGRGRLHVGDVREPLGPQERLRHILGREADAGLDDGQPCRLRRWLGGTWLGSHGQETRRPRQRERTQERPSAPALRASGTHGNLHLSHDPLLPCFIR